MKLLVVCSGNKDGVAAFIQEQMDGLLLEGIEVDWFLIQGKGIRGYLRALPKLKEKIAAYEPDLIHAHFGLSGLFANLQRQVPVVTTYHGCDVNDRKLRPLSLVCMQMSRYNIFVSKEQLQNVPKLFRRRLSVLPCGVDLDRFYEEDSVLLRNKYGFKPNKRYILFSSSYDRPVKNSDLAKSAIAILKDAELIELKGYNRDEVRELMNAVDAGLMTSISEGSPMFIKELIACGCPLVTTPVGDVKELLSGCEGGYISTFDKEDIAKKLELACAEKTLTCPEQWRATYDNKKIVERLYSIYNSLLK